MNGREKEKKEKGRGTRRGSKWRAGEFNNEMGKRCK
jgi:hypothetical protein